MHIEMKLNVLQKLKAKTKKTNKELAEMFGYCETHFWKMLHGKEPISKRILALLENEKR